mgnify:CR=1 FL=1
MTVKIQIECNNFDRNNFLKVYNKVLFSYQEEEYTIFFD